MHYTIKASPVFSYIECTLEAGEALLAEPDAMTSMASGLDLKARFNGGFFKGLLRKYLGGESLFLSEYKNSEDEAQTLTLSQATPGEIRCEKLTGQTFFMQPGAFIACSPGIRLGLKWAGFASFFAREGLFRLAAGGEGYLFYGAYGALLERQLDGEMIVDTSHLVAYEPGVRLKMQLAGGLFSSFFGGEGLVTRLEGEGKVIIQSRSLSGLASWLNPKL